MQRIDLIIPVDVSYLDPLDSYAGRIPLPIHVSHPPYIHGLPILSQLQFSNQDHSIHLRHAAQVCPYLIK